MEVDWMERIKNEHLAWERMHHLVVLPLYKESYEVIYDAVESLSKTNFPKDKIFILLAPEERGGMEKSAQQVAEELGHIFKGMLVVSHPFGISGELPGKGSNDTYAVRRAIPEMIVPSGIPIKDVLVSVFDIDTRPGKEYFGILTHAYLTAAHPDHSSYQPIPIFTNNVYKVPIFARLIGFSSTFWQLMQQARPEQLVSFSSHSIPLQALVDVGFWNVGIVNEDSHIFFQCVNHYNGDWRAVPLLYPVYMDSVEGKTTKEALINLYKQQRRWAWGIENVSYVFSDFWKNKTLSFRRKIFWTFTTIDGFYSWATSSFIIFLFGFLPNILGGFLFQSTIVSYNLPKITGSIINLTTFGIITSAFLSVRLLPPKQIEGHKWHEIVYQLLQWAFIPVTFIFFSAVPALEAQTRMIFGGRFKLGFWVTPKKVSE